jgi:hypothetical protein
LFQRFGLIVACSLLTGCALSKPIHQPGLIASWNPQAPVPSVDAPPIALSLQTRRTYGDDRPSSSWLYTWESDRAVQRALRKTLPQFSLLARAKPDVPDAPYRLVIDATTAQRFDHARLWTALTFFLIPFREELAVELEARFFREATLLKTYRASSTQQYTVHLLSMFVGGFFRYRASGRTIEDTFGDLFLQLQRDAPSLLQTPASQ